jgi:hypothetical protein
MSASLVELSLPCFSTGSCGGLACNADNILWKTQMLLQRM